MHSSKIVGQAGLVTLLLASAACKDSPRSPPAASPPKPVAGTVAESSTVTPPGGAPPSIPAALAQIDGTGALGFRLNYDLTAPPTGSNVVVKQPSPRKHEGWVGQERQLVVRSDDTQRKTITELSVVGRLPRLADGHRVGSQARDFEHAGKAWLDTGHRGQPCATFAKFPDVEGCFASEAQDLGALVKEGALVTSIRLVTAGESEGEEE